MYVSRPTRPARMGGEVKLKGLGREGGREVGRVRKVEMGRASVDRAEGGRGGHQYKPRGGADETLLWGTADGETMCTELGAPSPFRRGKRD